MLPTRTASWRFLAMLSVLPPVIIISGILGISTMGASSSARSDGAPPKTDPANPAARTRVALPEEDPNFIATLDALADRAALYRKYALGFTCRETVTTAKYDIESGGFRKSDKTVYDYIFEETPGGALREVREEVVERRNTEKTKGTDFEPDVTPAYAWATLFSRENRGRFHFRPAGQIVKAYRLLTLIDFIGTSPNPGGQDIAGWSGQVALEARSLNLWSVDAAPSGQDVRLEVEILRYRKAFAIAGVPLASRPHGWKLNVAFGMDVGNLSYPTEQVLSMTSLAHSQKMVAEEKMTFRYESYKFFYVEATQEEKGKDTPPPPPKP